MWQLNLPKYSFKIKKELEKHLIFDSFRKKYVVLTLEEWVRQNFLTYLVQEKSFPISLIAVEKQLIVNGLKKRCDAVIYNSLAQPIMIIEFKAPNVLINQSTFDQASEYNSKLRVEYLMISNGLKHFCCKVNFQTGRYEFQQEIESYSFYK